MTELTFVLLARAALCIAFVAGCAWNSDSYRRGYDDGRRDGFR